MQTEIWGRRSSPTASLARREQVGCHELFLHCLRGLAGVLTEELFYQSKLVLRQILQRVRKPLTGNRSGLPERFALLEGSKSNRALPMASGRHETRNVDFSLFCVPSA